MSKSEASPLEAWEWADKGTSLAKTGLLEEAIPCYQQALRINPNYAEAHHNLGLAYYYLGKLEEAVGEYKQALRIAPNCAEAHNSLGQTYYFLNKLEESVEEYKQALRIAPNYAEAHNNLGLSYRAQREFEEAIAEYQHALRVNPNYVEAHCNLGVVYRVQGKLDDAMREWQQALGINPNLAELHNNLANIYYERREIEEAIREYQQALKIDPKHFDAYYNLAVTYEAAGKVGDAIACYQRFIELAPAQAASLVSKAKESMRRLARNMNNSDSDREAKPGIIAHRLALPDDQDLIERSLADPTGSAGRFRKDVHFYPTKPTARSLRKGSASEGKIGETLTYDPKTKVPYPVLWVASERARKAGFGAPALTVHIRDEDLRRALDEPDQWEMICPKCKERVSLRVLLDTGRYNAIDLTELFCPCGEVQMMLEQI